MEKCIGLKSLSLQFNGLKALPRWMRKLRKLSFLNLGENQLTRVDRLINKS